MVDPREVIGMHVADVTERLPLKGAGRMSRVNCTRFLLTTCADETMARALVTDFGRPDDVRKWK